VTELSTPHEHVEFDAMCEQVDDYEPLPGVLADPAHEAAPVEAPEHAETIDNEILSGLVTP
jgi:hypothetical protein